jgi:hypothetical protein
VAPFERCGHLLDLAGGRRCVFIKLPGHSYLSISNRLTRSARRKIGARRYRATSDAPAAAFDARP